MVDYKQKLNELLKVFLILAGAGFFIFNTVNAADIVLFDNTNGCSPSQVFNHCLGRSYYRYNNNAVINFTPINSGLITSIEITGFSSVAWPASLYLTNIRLADSNGNLLESASDIFVPYTTFVSDIFINFSENYFLQSGTNYKILYTISIINDNGQMTWTAGQGLGGEDWLKVYSSIMPPTISNLNQYKSDAITAISESGTTSEDSVVFGATLNSSSTNQLQLQVELRPISGNFISQPTATSTFVSPGSTTTITVSNLTDGQYHWQARVVDSQGNASIWQEFGTAGNVDFIVDLPLSYKAANLAKLVVNGPYLGDGNTFGGKGWDIVERSYVTSDKILTGYNYWNNKLRTNAFGAGLDCSGLVEWAFNRSFNPSKSLTRNAIRWDGANGQYVHNSIPLVENLNSGDLLFLDKNNDGIKDHVGIYVSEGNSPYIIEAFSPQQGIRSTTKAEFETRIGFIASRNLRRVVISPALGGSVQAGSPINLTVTDPDGFTITATTSIQTDEEYLREVPGQLYYSQSEIDSDGRPEDLVYWPIQKTGNYIIGVVPQSGVSSTSTYGLTFQTGSTTILLAQNVPISQIPVNGYGIESSASSTINPFIPVSIDIKPGSYPNSVNLGSNGVVPVAIFGSATFDVHQINPLTIKFANAEVKLRGNGQPMVSYQDVNGDGFMDAIVNVSIEALQLTSSDVKANLNGQLINGTTIKGSDSVRIVP